MNGGRPLWHGSARSLMSGCACFAIALTATVAGGALFSVGVGVIAGVLALLATMVTIGLRGEGAANFVASLTASVMAVGAGGLAADRLTGYVAATATEILHDVSADDPKVANAGAMVFRTASVRAKLLTARTYRYSKPKGGGQESYTLAAAPVVDSTWTPAQPVRVWSVCRSSHCPGWASGWRSAVAVDAAKADDYTKVIAAAIAEHKLIAAVGPPVMVTMVADPRAAVEELRSQSVIIPAAFFSAWLGGFVLTWCIVVWQRASSRP